jgi:uncharacterized protein (TIGR02996 family)
VTRPVAEALKDTGTDNPELLGEVDDTPRLVYADWLSEHGQPERAELIRVQRALARTEPWYDSSYGTDTSGSRAGTSHRPSTDGTVKMAVGE